jgi:transcriptional regulator with XRE-family HTH domain
VPRRRSGVQSQKSDAKAGVVRLLGAQLRRLREDRELTQETLAELAGLNYKYVGRIELGKSDPGAYVLVRLAAALRVPIGELFETVQPGHTADDSTTHRLSPSDADSIIDAAAGLTALVNRILSRKPSPLPARTARRRR